VDVRDADETHLPGILAIYNEVLATSTAIFSDQPSTLDELTTWFRARRAQGYPVLVAVEGPRVLGYATFGDFRSWPGYRHTVEHSVHVAADARGRGIGGALMTQLLPRAVALDKHVMLAGIDASNAASIRFHERLGFERVGLLREVGCKFGRWLDLAFLQRRLDDRQAAPSS
jgi:phosphinothricin acetyltransferase